MLGSNSKLFSIILASLLGLSGLLYVLFVAEIIDEGILINWCYALLIVSGAVSVVFPIIAMAKDFKKSKNSLIGIGILVLIFVVGMVTASDESYTVGGNLIDGSVSKYSEAGLITFYVMIALAVVAIIYTEISKALK